MTTADIITWSGGVCPSHLEPREITGVSTDTRTLQPGNFFIALKGERFDGHDFIPQAIEKGVRGVLTSRRMDLPQGICLVQVDDTTEALKKIANRYRHKISAQVIAIVGSNGKTTCKNMLAAVLGKENRVTKTPANNNNKIGVSLTLLSAQPVDRFIIVEAGTNSPGELAELCRIIEPDHGLITNINAEHLEGFGNLEGVFQEESEILRHLSKKSYLSLPGDDQHYLALLQMASCQTVSAGFNPSSDLRITDWHAQSSRQSFRLHDKHTAHSATVQLPLPGRHMALNAALCLALACRLGMDLQKAADALESFRPEKGRLNILQSNGKTIIDDTYNANPSAMFSALDVLENMPGKKMAILGDMAELGPRSAELHKNVADHIQQKNIDSVVGVGVLAANYSQCGKPFYHFETTQQAITAIPAIVRDIDTVLVKGSRFMRMELIVKAITECLC